MATLGDMASQFEIAFVIEPISDPFDARIDRAEESMLGLVVSNSGALTTATTLVEATSALDAAIKAAQALDSSGIRVDRSYPDLVTRGDIADRLSVSRQAVGLWIRGERKSASSFPAPTSEVAGGIWLWRDVLDWADSAGVAVDNSVAYPSLSDHTRIDGLLAVGISGVSLTTYVSEVALAFSTKTTTRTVERHYQRSYALAS